jgi:hypothetical protein
MDCVVMFNIKSFITGILFCAVVLFTVFFYLQGEDYRNMVKRPPLSICERVGLLPNGKMLERYVIPYRGRVNGKTTNVEAEVFLTPKKNEKVK